jgi:transcriptional regulator with XRE-family HTH domain
MPGGVRIGKKLKEVRIRRLLTQEELARKAGLSPSTVVNIERDRSEPHFSTIRVLARALEIDPVSLLEDWHD